MEKELLDLMKETKMNESTIIGVMKLSTTPEIMEQVIKYIKRHKTYITDHQLRQYMARILIWDKS